MSRPQIPACAFCGGQAWGAIIREPVEPRDPVICGACGALSVADVVEGVASIRPPSREESVGFRQDERVRDALRAFEIEMIERGTEEARKAKAKGGKVKLSELAGRGPVALDPMTFYGPDHPNHGRA